MFRFLPDKKTPAQLAGATLQQGITNDQVSLVLFGELLPAPGN